MKSGSGGAVFVTFGIFEIVCDKLLSSSKYRLSVLEAFVVTGDTGVFDGGITSFLQLVRTLFRLLIVYRGLVLMASG